jgi:hypothetical protein
VISKQATFTQKLMAAADYQPTSESCRAAPGIGPQNGLSLLPELGPFLQDTRRSKVGHQANYLNLSGFSLMPRSRLDIRSGGKSKEPALLIAVPATFLKPPHRPHPHA